MATDIPSHNINEIIDATVFLLDNPRSELSELLEIIKGPDFSNNAPIIASEEELLEIYSTGRGGFKIQAQWAQERMTSS